MCTGKTPPPFMMAAASQVKQQNIPVRGGRPIGGAGQGQTPGSPTAPTPGQDQGTGGGVFRDGGENRGLGLLATSRRLGGSTLLGRSNGGRQGNR